MRILAFILALLFAAPVSGQTACRDRSEVIEHLARTYGENPVAIGMTDNGAVIELYSTPTGSTWTIMITGPSGRSCYGASGESWQSLTEPSKGQGT